MTMAAAIESRTAQANIRSKPSRIASVDIVADLGRAEKTWRELEEQQASHTPYQRFDFLAAWQRQVGEREHVRPFIAVASDAEQRPLLLLPLNSGAGTASTSQVSWAASIPPSTWRCGTASLRQARRRPTWKP